MSRLIDADALIKILKEWADTNAMRGYDTAYDVVQDCISTVENQPTVTDWIPCSERLPKDEELSQRKEVIVQNRYGEIFTAQYTYNSPKTRKDFFKEYCVVPYVLAWMPLPAPYQPKGE